MKRVSDMVKLDWNVLFDMNIYEFLNYAVFCIEYAKMEEEQIKKWKKTN